MIWQLLKPQVRVFLWQVINLTYKAWQQQGGQHDTGWHVSVDELLKNKLDLLESFAEALQEPDATVESLLQNYFTLAGQPELTEQDYFRVGDHYTLTQEHLDQVCAQQIQGVNILVYGPPGTGKTEFAKSVAKTLGFNLYEVNIGDEEHPFSRPNGYVPFNSLNRFSHVKKMLWLYLTRSTVY